MMMMMMMMMCIIVMMLSDGSRQPPTGRARAGGSSRGSTPHLPRLPAGLGILDRYRYGIGSQMPRGTCDVKGPPSGEGMLPCTAALGWWSGGEVRRRGRAPHPWMSAAPAVTVLGGMEPLQALDAALNASTDNISSSIPLLEAPDQALHHTDPLHRYAGIFFLLLLDLVALVANVAVAVVILKAPKLRKFLFVVHLCIIDTLAAITVMPLGIVESSGLVAFGGPLCQAYVSLEVCFSSASILTVSAINIERYYYIVHPMRYEVKMTLGLAVSVMVFIWFQSSLTSILPFFSFTPQVGDGMEPGNDSLVNETRCSLQRNAGGHRKVFVAFFVLLYFVVPLLIILTVYCNVFKVARIAALQHGPLPSWTASPRQRSNSNGSQANIMAGDTSHRVSPERTLGGVKAAFTLMIIGGQFVMCWLPYFFYHMHNALEGNPHKISGKWENIVRWFAYTSFTVNPFFYGCLNRQIRDELTRIPKCFLKQSLDEQLGLSSQEGSVEENFLQFLQRTSCVVERRNSFPISSGAKLLVNQSTLSFRIPGQISEETPELTQQDYAVGFRSLQTCTEQENFLGVTK
uniref:G-protein coupled receptors family 1 profile domain-containing protein n=1 Tax=Leptobrachium leishanense TaxID=445787 RepID=A0A8C5MLF4_9ANUR